LDEILQWDREILIYLNNLGVQEYDWFWLLITKFSTWIPLYLAIVALLFWKNTIKQGIWMLLSYFSMLSLLYVIIYTVKNSIGRLRPNNDESINMLIRVIQEPSEFSFFSGHTAVSFGIAAITVLFLHRKLRWIHFVWIYPLLFSYSRIYLGVHYPIDLIVGAIVGMFFAWIFHRTYQKLKAPYISSTHP